MAIVGLDANRPIDESTGEISPTINPDFAGEVSYVRINFVRGPWDSPQHPTWLERYDEIVDAYLERGIQVYGLIGHEIMRAHPKKRFQNSQLSAEALGWIEGYVRYFVTIVKHFEGRVHIWESFNEPNNWFSDTGQPFVSPFWFAKMLAEIYRAVKITHEMPDLTLVSGPLLGHNFSGTNFSSTAAPYLEETFQAGKRYHGWDELRDSELNNYPLDGLGYHLYVEQGANHSTKSVATTIRLYLDQILAVWRQQDGLAARKQLYISEFGWQSEIVGDKQQAENMRAAFDLFRQEPRVALAIWFGTQDFPNAEGNVESWGLYAWGELAKTEPKPKNAHKELQQIATEDKEPSILLTVADRFQFPIGRPGYDIDDHFKRDNSFLSAFYYKLTGAWSPGEDWNLRTGWDSDLGEPVYAMANGRVVTSDHFPIWGNIIVIAHQLPNNERIWSQYAYLDDRQVERGEWVKRGDQIGTIGKGEKNQAYAHLHIEIRRRDLPANNWFPMVGKRDEVIVNYINPSAFIKAHRASDARWGDEFIIESENTNQMLGTFRKADVEYWFRAPFGLHGSTLWTYASPEKEENWSIWSAKLRQSGRYELFVFVPSDHASTRNAQYTIRHQGGLTRVVLNQSHFYDEWVSLGIYPFHAGDSGSVRLSDVTNEPRELAYERQIAFDAIKWVFIEEAEAPPFALVARQASIQPQTEKKRSYYERVKSAIMPWYWKLRDMIAKR